MPQSNSDFIYVPPNWSPEPQSSPFWHTNRLNANIKTASYIDTILTLAAVLELHDPRQRTFDVIELVSEGSYKRRKVLVHIIPSIQGVQINWHIDDDDDVGPSDVAVFMDNPGSCDLASLNVSLSVAFLIVLHRQDISHMSATYNTYDVSSSHANWFLLHCALGFEALQSARPSSALRSTSLITKAEDALFCSPAIPSRYDESQIRVLKFDVDFLHQTFLRRIQYQPLSDCMRTSSGTVVSCLTTHLIAARLASRLSQIGVYNGDVVYIGLQDASHVAICTVAVLYTGAGFAIMSTPPVCEAPVLSSQKSLVVLVEHSRATEWLVTAVLFDPTDIIMELSTKDQVSLLRDNLGNDTFAIGSPTSSKIAYAVSTMTTQYQEFLVVDHRQACDAMRRHHSRLFRGASPRFVVLTGVGNHYLGNVVWHAFWSGAAITFLGENDKDKLLNRVVEFNCTHIIVAEDEFEQVAKILIHAHKYMHGQSELHEQAGVSGLRSLKNIVVCCPGPITGQSVETLRNESVETRSYHEDYSGLRHNLKPTIKHPIEVLYSDPAEHDVAPQYILEKIPTGTLPHASFGAMVKISESLLVKYNQRVRKAEADMMIYVQLHTTIRVPRVILIFRQGEVTYIVMELVPGRNLQEVWDDLDTVTRQTVMAQISSYRTDASSP